MDRESIMVAAVLCVCEEKDGKNERVRVFLARFSFLLFSTSTEPASKHLLALFFVSFSMPRGRGAPPRPVARAPIAKATTIKKSSSHRRSRQDDSDDEDDRPGPADAFYEAEDAVAPEDAGGASAMRFDVSFFSFSGCCFFVLPDDVQRFRCGVSAYRKGKTRRGMRGRGRRRGAKN